MTYAIFWVSFIGLVYIYVGYPVLIRGLAKLRPLVRQKVMPSFPTDDAQKVSLVVSSYNDAAQLEAKLRDLLASPQSQWIGEILVGSDGSTDSTREMIAALNEPRVALYSFEQRRGKPAVLNHLVPRCRFPIVVLCDARQLLSNDAIPQLLSNFADPRVGVVSGELVLRESDNETTAGRGIGAYWKYEKLIRRAEGRFRSVPGATGALYAIRRELFRPIPESTLLDDVVVPMQAITQGALCVFERSAVAYDRPSETLEKEATRKRRTIAGAAQLILHHPQWLFPWRNPIWFEYVSHKVLRLCSPILLIACLASHLPLIGEPLYFWLFVGHAFFYYSAFAGWCCQRMGQKSVLFGIQLMFFMLNATTVAALWDAARGKFRVTWKRA